MFLTPIVSPFGVLKFWKRHLLTFFCHKTCYWKPPFGGQIFFQKQRRHVQNPLSPRFFLQKARKFPFFQTALTTPLRILFFHTLKLSQIWSPKSTKKSSKKFQLPKKSSIFFDFDFFALLKVCYNHNILEGVYDWNLWIFRIFARYGFLQAGGKASLGQIGKCLFPYDMVHGTKKSS